MNGKSLTSHTIVRNGMPFIGLVLRQVEPYMEKMLIDLSVKSNDGTKDVVEKFRLQYPDKVVVTMENWPNITQVTKSRQRQIDATRTDWIMILDDDDYWCHDDLENSIKELDDKYDAFSHTLYQMIDFKHYESSWLDKKSFTKFIRKQDGLNMIKGWPKELFCLNEDTLYWKTNKKVRVSDYRFYHLALMKDNSFRDEKGYERIKNKVKKIGTFK